MAELFSQLSLETEHQELISHHYEQIRHELASLVIEVIDAELDQSDTIIRSVN